MNNCKKPPPLTPCDLNMYNCKVKFKKQDYIKIMNPCLHNPKYLSQGNGLNFLTQCNMNYFLKIQCTMKNLRTLGVLLNSMH
jgi:hypothetical protein